MARKMLIQIRRDTAANWTSADPILAAGEPGFETDTGKVKFGDGSTHWTSLAYISGGGGGGASPLTTKGDVWGFDTVDDRIPVGTDGQVLTADSTQTLGLKWATPGAGSPGGEIGYAQITAPVNITDTAEATATALISSGALTFDGSPVWAHFFAPEVLAPTGAVTDTVIFTLFEGSTQICRWGGFRSLTTVSGGNNVEIVNLWRRFTPSAGTHTYKLCAYVTDTTSTPKIQAGSGGTGGFAPAFLRFIKV